MSPSCPFIFIHLGSEYYPDYIVHAIRQARKWNPSAEIYFIAEACHASKAAEYPCKFVSLDTIETSAKRAEFCRRSKLDMKFRNGFWRYTTERLFVLEDFMNSREIMECIHLENDNMIYFDLEYMLPTLREEYRGIAAPYLGKGEITFGILYVANVNTLSNLNVFLLGMSHTGQNEMKLGCQFILENRGEADFLPVVSNECDVRDEDFHYATAHGSAFRGVFDAAAYGQYLGGIDERNGDGLQIGFVNKTSAFPSDQFEYKPVKFDDSLMFWSAHRHGNSWPIYVLHVHSKYLEMFAS